MQNRRSMLEQEQWLKRSCHPLGLSWPLEESTKRLLGTYTLIICRERERERRMKKEEMGVRSMCLSITC